MKADIEVTYEYGVVKGKQGRVAPIIRDGKAHFPIQLQMEYTAVDGARLMRVFTRAMPVTTNPKLPKMVCIIKWKIILDTLQNAALYSRFQAMHTVYLNQNLQFFIVLHGLYILYL